MIFQKKKKRTLSQLREHYEIEKELANRLRTATKEQRRRLYNIVYDERIQRIPHHPLAVQAADSRAQAKAVKPQIRLLKTFFNSETVFMEIGPGDCALAAESAKFVKEVYAVDVSKELVGQDAFPPNFKFILTDGLEIPVPPRSVTVAYSNQMMEHLHPEDAYEQLMNIYQTLTPGGIYICITPNPLSGPWDISRNFDPVATGLHLKEYSIANLVDIFERAGFSKVSALITYHGFRLSPQLPAAPWIWIEKIIGKLPRYLRKKYGFLLAVVKIIASK